MEYTNTQTFTPFTHCLHKCLHNLTRTNVNISSQTLLPFTQPTILTIYTHNPDLLFVVEFRFNGFQDKSGLNQKAIISQHELNMSSTNQSLTKQFS